MSKTEKGPSSLGQRLIVFVCALLGALILLSGASYGAYRLALANVGHENAIIWALLEMALLPISLFAGYKWGKVESRGTLNGLAAGVSAVMGAASQVADVKVSTTRRMRQPDPVTVELPPLPQMRYISSVVEGEVIDV